MPVYLRYSSYKVFFWVNENDEPIHFHITDGNPSESCTKVWILKESLIKSRLTAWHASCLHIFRHLAQKILDRRQPACGFFGQPDEKSDGAICAPDLISASLKTVHSCWHIIRAGFRLMCLAEYLQLCRIILMAINNNGCLFMVRLSIMNK